MQDQRVILVNGSRLMRDLIKRVIEKNAGFEVVQELSDVQDLPSAVAGTDAEWVFAALSSQQEIPESLKTELFNKHPTLHIVGLWVDGGHVKVEWLGRQQMDLSGLTLDELTHLLKQELRTVQDGKYGSS